MNCGQVEETVFAFENHQAVFPGLKFVNSFLYSGVPSQESRPALWSEKQVRFPATFAVFAVCIYLYRR